MAFTGEALNYFMAGIYTVTGAVMGTTPGSEFLAAIEAARTLGAQVGGLVERGELLRLVAGQWSSRRRGQAVFGRCGEACCTHRGQQHRSSSSSSSNRDTGVLF